MIRLPYLSGRVRVTSPYGSRELNGVAEYHSGIDLVGDDCKQLVAPVDGLVIQSRIVTDYNNLTWQWGNYVCICGDDGMYYYLCHMSQRCVEQYQFVKAGDLVGIEGNTGYSFGSHCHFEVRTAAGSGAFNPCGLLGVENYAGYTKLVEVVEKVDNYETKAIAAGAHDWSQDAIVWALQNNILKGDDSGLRLSDGLTREEFTVMLHRLYNLICDDDGK